MLRDKQTAEKREMIITGFRLGLHQPNVLPIALKQLGVIPRTAVNLKLHYFRAVTLPVSATAVDPRGNLLGSQPRAPEIVQDGTNLLV